MKLKKENELEKNCETESSKKDDESERKKESEQKKESEKKRIVKRKETEENEREKKNKRVFMLRRVMSRVLFIQTSLYLYTCTKRHVLILTNLMNLCLMLLSLCCRNMRTCFLTMCLVDCHILEE